MACDVGNYRIPNGLLALAGITGLWAAAWSGFEAAGLWAAAGIALAWLGRGLLVCAVTFPFYRWGMVGPGDCKLMAFIAAWLGFFKGMQAIGLGFVIGAVLALVKLLRQGSLCRRFLYLTAYIRRLIVEKEMEAYYDAVRDGRDCVIPLGACICAGAAVVGLLGS